VEAWINSHLPPSINMNRLKIANLTFKTKTPLFPLSDKEWLATDDEALDKVTKVLSELKADS